MTEENKFVTPPTAAAHWKSFSDMQGLASKHPIQRIEMRKAFYAGIFSMMNIYVAVANCADDDDGIAILRAVEREIETFANDHEDEE